MNRKAALLTGGGLILLAAALCLAVYNLWDERRAADSAEQLVLAIASQTAALETSGSQAPASPPAEGDASQGAPEEAGPAGPAGPEAEPRALEIDGNQYIGTLELPALGLTLPVMSDWSYPKLKLSPCRFSGSVYQDDMIVAAHNYRLHFGRLKDMKAGDEVVFTDTEGQIFSYTVSELELVGPKEIERLKSGDWDLTLFTCTLDNSSRVTVRCVRTQDGGSPKEES